MSYNDRGDRRRGRSRSDSRDRKRNRSHHHHDVRRTHDGGSRSTPAVAAAADNSPTNRQPLSGKVISMEDLDVTCCLRIGVLNAPAPVTREQVLNEIEAIKLVAHVETVLMEPRAEGSNDYWASVFFTTPAFADKACAELNVPLRTYRWKLFVTQRLPLPGSLCGEIGTMPVFQPLDANPADTVVVDTQEGFVFFSTDELYKTRGVEDSLATKRNDGKIVRRLICKHFDPEQRIPCRYGLQCMFIHVKACAIGKLLRTVTMKSKLRFPKNEADIQVSSWDFERRTDTLVVRYLEPAMDGSQLHYMFEGCAGYKDVCVGTTAEGMRYGMVRFLTRVAAFDALAQTFDSGLAISFYGCMEDVRRVMMHDPAFRMPHNHNAIISFSNANPQNATSSAAAVSRSAQQETSSAQAAPAKPLPVVPTMRAAAAAVSPPPQREASSEPRALPFPPLPAGWEYGESRKTSQYYFFQPKTKNPTTWQHPITHERYTF